MKEGPLKIGMRPCELILIKSGDFFYFLPSFLHSYKQPLMSNRGVSLLFLEDLVMAYADIISE